MITGAILTLLMVMFLWLAISSRAALNRQLYRKNNKRVGASSSHISCMACHESFTVDQKEPWTICPRCLQLLGKSHTIKQVKHILLGGNQLI